MTKSRHQIQQEINASPRREAGQIRRLSQGSKGKLPASFTPSVVDHGLQVFGARQRAPGKHREAIVGSVSTFATPGERIAQALTEAMDPARAPSPVRQLPTDRKPGRSAVDLARSELPGETLVRLRCFAVLQRRDGPRGGVVLLDTTIPGRPRWLAQKLIEIRGEWVYLPLWMVRNEVFGKKRRST